MTKHPPMEATPETVAVRSARVISADLDGEVVLFAEPTGAVHILSTSAALIWASLDGSENLGEIASALAEVFGADEQVVRNDVLGTVSDFARLGLLAGFEPTPQQSPPSDQPHPRILPNPPDS